MRTIETRAIISATDRTGNVFAQIANKLRLLQGTARGAGSTSAVAAGAIQGLGGALAMVGGAAAVGYGAQRSIRAWADIEKGVTQLGLTAEVSKEKIADAIAETRKLGPEFGVKPTEIAKAAEQYVMAGLSFDTAMKGLRTTLTTSKASGADVEDIAKAGVAAISNFKIPVENLQSAFDIMARSGKLGQFELRNMAKDLPTIGSAAARVGLTGENGLAKVTAMLQTVRKVVASGDEATNRFENAVQKIFLDTTQKNFEKFGINWEKWLKENRDRGVDAVTATVAALEKVTKGMNETQKQLTIGKIFNDMQAQQFFQAMMQHGGFFAETLKATMRDAAGTIRKDFGTVMDLADSKMARLGASANVLGTRIGEALSKHVLPIVEGANKLLDRIETHDPNVPQGTSDADKKFYRYWDYFTGLGQQPLTDVARHVMSADERKRIEAATDPANSDAVKKLRAAEDGIRRMRPSNPERAFAGLYAGPVGKAADAAIDNAGRIKALLASMDENEVRMTEIIGARRALSASAIARGGAASAPIVPGLLSFGATRTGYGKGVPGAADYALPNRTQGLADRQAGAPAIVPVLDRLETILGGKIEATVKPDQIKASLDPNSRVEVNVRVKVEGNGTATATATGSGSARGSVGVTYEGGGGAAP